MRFTTEMSQINVLLGIRRIFYANGWSIHPFFSSVRFYLQELFLNRKKQTGSFILDKMYYWITLCQLFLKGQCLFKPLFFNKSQSCFAILQQIWNQIIRLSQSTDRKLDGPVCLVDFLNTPCIVLVQHTHNTVGVVKPCKISHVTQQVALSSQVLVHYGRVYSKYIYVIKTICSDEAYGSEFKLKVQYTTGKVLVKDTSFCKISF